MEELKACPMCMNKYFCMVTGNACHITPRSMCDAFKKAYNLGCRTAPENKPPTNADRIRSMSDEELTRFIQSDLPIFRTFGEQLNWLGQPYARKPEGSTP